MDPEENTAEEKHGPWSENEILENAKGLWFKDENLYTAISGDVMYRYIPKPKWPSNNNLPVFLVRRLDPKTGMWILVAEIKTKKNKNWRPC